jgi:hypothetical protein
VRAVTPLTQTLPLKDPDAGSRPDALANVARIDDRYDVGEALGSGGMGAVFACRDRLLGRTVALKCMHAGLGEHPEYLQRFVREAQLQSRLEHPSIVAVHDFGVWEGNPYFTMKHVRGTTLRAVLDRLARGDPDASRAHPSRRLLSVFVTLCQAVEYAHARGVVHRDIKPENVMMGDYGEVYLLDWGVAKLLNDVAPVTLRNDVLRSDRPAEATDAGALLGTAGYMAPEQARAAGAVDARADVYALGAILFEIVTLQRLHEGEAIQRAVSTLRGVDVVAKARAAHRGSPPALIDICSKAASSSCDERFGSVGEMRMALERFLDGGHNANPPEVLPDEVLVELADHDDQVSRRMLVPAALLLASPLALMPLVVWAGVRDAAVLAVGCAVFLIGALTPLIARKWLTTPRARLVFTWPVSIAVGVVLGTAFSPIVLAPAALTLSAVCHALLARGPHLVLVGAGNVLAAALPIGLGLLGVMPAAFRLESGRIHVDPWLVHLGAPAAWLLLLSLSLVPLAGALFAHRFRRELEIHRRRAAYLTWQLRHLLPAAPSRAPGSA